MARSLHAVALEELTSWPPEPRPVPLAAFKRKGGIDRRKEGRKKMKEKERTVPGALSKKNAFRLRQEDGKEPSSGRSEHRAPS